MSTSNFKNRNANMTLSSPFQNKWQNRKRTKTATDMNEQPFSSPGKQRKTFQQQQKVNDNSESSSDSEDSEMETVSDPLSERATTSKEQSTDIDKTRHKWGSNESDDNGSKNVLDNMDEDESDDNDDLAGGDNDSDEEVTETVAKGETEDEFSAVKKELANIPLEDLMKIKEKLGLKMFNKIMHGNKFEDKRQKNFKRANKNRPRELSSKKWVSVLRQVEVPKPKVSRDPRFDDLSGEFQDKHFTKNYSFLDEIKSKEKLLVQKKLKKTKSEEKKKELSKLLHRMTQQEQSDKQKKRKSELEKQWKEKEKQLVKEGKTPFFLKKSEKKKLELAEKFKELQQSGKIDQYMNKKLKKNAKKEKKKLPGRHEKFT